MERGFPGNPYTYFLYRIVNVSSGCGTLSTFNFLSQNQNLSASFGTSNAASLYFQNSIQAIISSRCAEESKEIGRLGYFWKLPVINRVGIYLELFRRELFPVVTHFTGFSVVAIGETVAKLMQRMNQTQVFRRVQTFCQAHIWPMKTKTCVLSTNLLAK